MTPATQLLYSQSDNDTGFDLVDVRTILAHLREHTIERLILSPRLWAECRLSTTLQWTVVKYDKSEKDKLPETTGVYTFIVKPGIANHPECSYLLYVGKTDHQTLKTRFLQYFSEAKKKKGRAHIKVMLDVWKDHLWYCFASIDDASIIDDIENTLLNAYVPPMNREFKGIIGEARKAWS